MKSFADLEFEALHIGWDGVGLTHLTPVQEDIFKIEHLSVDWKGNTEIQGLFLPQVQMTFSTVRTTLLWPQIRAGFLQHQKISFDAVEGFVPCTNGVLDISTKFDDEVEVHEAACQLLGGKLTIKPFKAHVGNDVWNVTALVKSIDLSQLIAMTPLEGLQISGKAEANIPFKFDHGHFYVVKGVLKAQQSGEMTYASDRMPTLLQTTRQPELIALRAILSHFLYERIEISIDGEIGQNQTLLIEAKGHNPQFQAGRAIDLKFRVEGPLQNVIKYGSTSSLPELEDKR